MDPPLPGPATPVEPSPSSVHGKSDDTNANKNDVSSDDARKADNAVIDTNTNAIPIDDEMDVDIDGVPNANAGTIVVDKPLVPAPAKGQKQNHAVIEVDTVKVSSDVFAFGTFPSVDPRSGRDFCNKFRLASDKWFSRSRRTWRSCGCYSPSWLGASLRQCYIFWGVPCALMRMKGKVSHTAIAALD